ncbi:T9SS type B sorting domain-containing protein [Capnocytophaga sp.]
MQSLKKQWVKCCTLFLLLFTGMVKGQVVSVLTESPVHIAGSADFSAGVVTITFNMPAGKTSGELEVKLPAGIEYAQGLTATGGTVTWKTGSPANKPVFTISGAGAVVTVSFKRKVTKAVLSNPDFGEGFLDTAVLKIDGASTPAKHNDTKYQLQRPTLAVQFTGAAGSEDIGTHTRTFTIRNTGNGKAKDVYFSVDYPTDVTGNGFWHNNIKLTSMTINGKTVYKVPNVNLANNDFVTITENYTISKCSNAMQNIYYAHWGKDNEIFETTSNAKNIQVKTGTPSIELDTNNTSTYFEWGNGLMGNTLGTFTLKYKNNGKGENPTAYNIILDLFERWNGQTFVSYKPSNIRLVAADGTELIIPSTALNTPDGTNGKIVIDFSKITALKTNDATYGSKDFGFTDENGDGFKRELKKDAAFTLRFDYVKNQTISCLMNTASKDLNISPFTYLYTKNVCGQDIPRKETPIHSYTFTRLLSSGDSSKFPIQLFHNVPMAGYVMAATTGFAATERTKGNNNKNNDSRLKYQIKLPAGVALKNIKFYKATAYGTSTKAPIDLGNAAAGTTFNYTTADTEFGYITFDIVLENCVGNSVKFDYSAWFLDKNEKTNTYAEVPLVCVTNKSITAICSSPCGLNGPEMLSTKVERADNSYGWTDHNMTTRTQRSQVSELQRQRALYLDDIEVISTGKQLNVTTKNLYYHASFAKEAGVTPKSITFNTATHSITLQASNTIVTKTTVGERDYFLWNLTSALPSAGIPANGTFTTVATYQLTNGEERYSNSKDIESGGESFYYRLNDPATDTAKNAQGYHTAQIHCGANLYATFYFAGLYSVVATNDYVLNGCAPVNLGNYQVHSARRFNTGGTYFTDEFRPARLVKKVTFTVPSSVNYVDKVTYMYRTKYPKTEEINIPISKFVLESDNGTYKVYSYTNPPKGQPGHLPVGEISAENAYDSYFQPWMQATCKTKVVKNLNEAKAANMLVTSKLEYEDFYYHYAARGGQKITSGEIPENKMPLYFKDVPSIDITPQTALSVKASKREQILEFKLSNNSFSDAPYTWVSIPNIAGVDILSLTEISSTKAHVYTYTAQSNISGEQMFFLSDKGGNGTIAKGENRYFRVIYKITNCEAPLHTLKLYAGWNCNSNPTSGYQSTCSDKSLTYNITVAKSRKEIEPDANNPGQNKPDKVGTIPMCTATPYSYIINSASEGDIYDAKLVVTQGAGISFSDIEVEYPLNSGNKFYVNSGTKRIGYSQSGNTHTFDISNILPGGSLPGSISEPNNANQRKFKLTFKVTPDCDFTAGSSFDIDIEGNNLCGKPAAGDKTRAIIAGITGVNISEYSINLDNLTYVNGNGSACDTGVTYRTRVTVNASNPAFEIGDNARLRFRIPKGYEFVSGAIQSRSSGTSWTDPARKTAEDKDVRNEREISVTVPKGMKNGHSFEYNVTIKQKDNATIDCATPKELSAFTTDTVTGVTCATAQGGKCGTFTVNSSPRRSIVIKNERPSLSFSNVAVSSKAENNKEKITVTYKITNGATASATLTARPVVASLYYDANNNGEVDANDTKLTTYSSTETLAKGATSAERSFTHLVDADKVCRLLLALKNEDNVCLCGDVVSALPAPTTIEGLTQSFTTCATSSITLAPPAAAATYTGYIWSAVSPANALGYLSANNVATPTFLYNGANITSPLVVTYKLTLKRYNGCEAVQTVTVQVSPQGINLTTPAPLVVNCKNATASITQWLNSASAADTCGNAASVTHNYDTVKPADLCNNSGIVTVTFVGKDALGNTATQTRTITLVNIDAVDDDFTFTDGSVSTTSTRTVLVNDKVGTRTATIGTVSLTVITPAVGAAGSATPTLNANGTVTVPAGTKSGTYYIGYRICSTVANISVCDTATATVVVGTPTITADPDTFTITTGTSTKSVLDNDKIGTATATTNTVSISVVTGATPKQAGTNTPTLDSDGKVTVPNNTPAGTYTIVYQICDKLNSGNCATTTATVVVGNPTITADPDTFTITTGTSTKSVLDNDKIGTATATTNTVSISVVTGATPKQAGTNTPTLDSDGKITVPNNTPAGTYTIVYQICDKLNSGNCATTTATVVVGNPTITADPDTFTITTGTSTKSVLDNDKIGTATATTNTVSISVVTDATPKQPGTNTPTLDSDGKVTVPNNTPAGTYTIVYQICDKLNSGNCATTTATVVVGTPTITADPDTFTITTGTSTKSVLDNDKIGTATATTNTVNISVVTGATPKQAGTNTPTLDSDGKVTVPNNTPAGTYTIVYQICDKLNSGNCATTTATVVVDNPTITADPDTFTITTGTSTKSVLDNDKIGTATATTNTVSISVVTGATPKQPGTNTPTLDSDGKVTVPNNTPAGTYTIVYQICDKLNSGNCATTTATVVVGTTTPTAPVPVAVDDRATTPLNTPVTINVLGNDTPEGATPNVTTNPANGSVSVNSDGSIEYRPHTDFAGTDTFVYELCNASGCATATVTVEVIKSIVVYNAISLSSDKNDHFHIAGIESYPNNVVRIYNRWGVKVWEAEHYDNIRNVFKGISNGRVTVEAPNKLPQGTYYYVIEYTDEHNQQQSKVGWLYIKK